jgi:peptidoglycan/xylan/chitin deacetylase (PgdA/CDA1 family)
MKLLYPYQSNNISMQLKLKKFSGVYINSGNFARILYFVGMKTGKPLQFIIFLAFMYLFTGCLPGKSEKTIHVIFRFDDYSEKSNTEFEKKIIGLFKDQDISFTCAVIPFVSRGDIHDTARNEVLPLSQEKAEILKNAFSQGIAEVALHGYNHQSVRHNVNTEFRGVPAKEQKEKILNGKAFLEEITGAPVVTFVPPWNSYDLNTLHILEEDSFQILSASTMGMFDIKSTLKFIPCTTTPDKLIQSVKNASASYDENPLVVVMIHEYDFVEIDARHGIVSFNDFKKSLEWLKQQRNVITTTLAGFNDENSDLSPNRMELNSRILSLRNKMLSFARPKLKGYYYSEPDLIYARFRLLIYVITILIAIGIAAYFLSGFLKKFINRIRYLILVVLAGLLTAIGLFVKFNPAAGYKILLLLIILTGVSVGLLVYMMLHSGKMKKDASG